MSLLGRLKRWLGLGSADDAGGEANGASVAGEPEPSLKCTVCGTDVDADATACPLCKSTDLRPATPDDAADPAPDRTVDEREPSAGRDDASGSPNRNGDRAESDAGDFSGPGPTETRSRTSETEDEAVNRLQKLRKDGESDGERDDDDGERT